MPAFNAIINALELNPSIIVDLAEEFSPSRRHRRLHPDKWSALEHIAHLARVGSMLNVRLKQMLKHPDRAVVPYDPDRDDPEGLKTADWNESLSRYQWDRAEFVGILREVDPPTWERPVPHPEYVRYSIRLMARHAALHDLSHGYRIEELLSAGDA